MRIFAKWVWAASTVVVFGCLRIGAQPVLPHQDDRTIAELSFLNVTNTATGGTNLTYILQHPPAGASISTNGIIFWRPLEDQGPTNVTITTIVIDDALHFDTNSFTVTVTETNQAPQLPGQSDQTATDGSTLLVTNTASDFDVPTNSLTYQLVNPPSGALIDPNGIISWTPASNLLGTTNTFKTIVTDNGSPPLSATNSFNVRVISGQFRTNILLACSISLTALVQGLTPLGTNFGLPTIDPTRIGSGDVIKAIATEIGHGTNNPVGGKLYLITDISDPNAPSKFVLRTTTKDYDVSQYLTLAFPATRRYDFIFGFPSPTAHQLVTTERANFKAGTFTDSTYTIVGFSLSTSQADFDVQGLASYKATSVKDGNKLISSTPFPTSISVAVSGSGAGTVPQGRRKMVFRGTVTLGGRKIEIVPKT
jgi:hypothetical protein